MADPDAVKRAQKALRLGCEGGALRGDVPARGGRASRRSVSRRRRCCSELLRAELEVDDHTGRGGPAGGGRDAGAAAGARRGGAAGGGAPAAGGDAALHGAARGGVHPGEQLGRGAGVARAGAGAGAMADGRRSAGAGRGVLCVCRRCRRRRGCAGWRTWRSRRRTWSSCRGCRRARSRMAVRAGVRECHDQEMLRAGLPRGGDPQARCRSWRRRSWECPRARCPRTARGTLFIHLRCAVCGKEKLMVQSPVE